jgi:photosystem II stability/assembly factor-like uncharacterized protein
MIYRFFVTDNANNLAYTRGVPKTHEGIRMTKHAAFRGAASLLACLLLGGCVNNVAIEPEATSLSWTNTGCPGRQRVNAIAIDPDGRIVLAVYDYEREDASIVGTVYVSSDDGETWTAGLPKTTEIQHVAVDSEGRIFAASWDNICRSTDHGRSWTTLPFRHFLIQRIVIDPNDYVYLPIRDGGIYFSDDHGDSWTQIGAGILRTGGLVVNSKGCIFTIGGDALYISCDRGASWTEPSDVPWGDLSGYVAIDGEDRIVIAGYSGLYRSLDDGETWTALDSLEFQYVDDISFDAAGRLYVVCGARLYVSNDLGDSWNLRIERINRIYGVASNEAGDVFITGVWGVGRSMNGDEGVEMLGFFEPPLSDMAVGSNGYCYVAASCGGVYRSSGALERWERFNGGLTDVSLYSLTTANDSLLVAGTSDGVYVSPLARPEWSRVGLGGSRVKKVFAFPGDSIVAFRNNALLVSADGGGSWNNLGMKGYEINALIGGADGGLIAGTSFGGVFRYTGEGILWDQMNEGLGDLHVNALAAARGGEILAGTETGVFISSNGGASWRRFSNDRIWINDIRVEDKDVFIGSTKGVFRATLGTAVLRPQNDGLLSYDLYSIISIALDPGGRLLLLTERRLLRSSPPLDVSFETH